MNRPFSRGAELLLLSACSALLACASGREAVAGQTGQGSASVASTLPACAKGEASIERPAAFPADFPLPPGTVVIGQEERSGHRLILHTRAPTDVQGVARFFAEALPGAGYTQSQGESEQGEAEANYAGKGVQGRWRANAIPDCPGAVMLDVLAAPKAQ